MKEITLTKNRIALVNDDDFVAVQKHKWCAQVSGKNEYATAWISGKLTSMHRFIMKPRDGLVVDHINGNGLDNRKENLRVCTRSQNAMNARPRANTISGVKGVSYNKSILLTPWVAQIRSQGKTIFIGYYATKEEAAEAYKKISLKYFGDFSFFARSQDKSTH